VSIKAVGARRTGLVSCLAAAALLIPASADAGTRNAWTHVSGKPPPAHAGHPQVIKAPGMATFTLDQGAIAEALDAAPASLEPGDRPVRVTLPAPNGGFELFEVAETTVMAPKLARLHPEIRTYTGVGVDEPRAGLRITLSPLGLQASVRGGRFGAWYIDPVYRRDTSLYGSYVGADLINRHGPLIEPREIDSPAALDDQRKGPISSGSKLRTYRLALLTDPSYATFFGAANVTAAKVALINRVDQIYEDELAVRMVLIGNNDLLNFNTAAQMTGTNGPCGAAACYTASQATSCAGVLGRTRIVIGQVIGASNFDIGHIGLGLGQDGIAVLGVVGRSAKALGCTGLSSPVGDFYAVDYVAHEMGHQFGGDHTFNGVNANCGGGNRTGSTSVEPGSGSSIMAYAGICDLDDLQPHSDPYFSQRSFDEIETYVASSQAAIDEIQSAALTGFDGADSFTLTYGANTSGTITNGVNYSAAGIEAALLPILPAGVTVTVGNFGGGGAPSASGFQVRFGGTLAGQNVPNMVQLTNVSGFTGSVNEIDKGGAVDNGGAVTSTGNTPPVVTAPASYTIPYRTPFALTGSATDANGDPLTYMWEQDDVGTGGGTSLIDPQKTSGPLFRQFGTALDASIYNPDQYDSPGENHPTRDPTRVFPDMDQVLAGNTNANTGDCPNGPPPLTPPVPPGLIDCYSEFLPTPAYTGPMHFRLTARDGRAGGGGVASAETIVSLAPGTGPFRVTAPSAPRTRGSRTTQTVTWDVAGTAGGAINATNVRISLSTDGGGTFPVTLAESTANDGSAQVTPPAVTSNEARIKIEALGNVFFDVSDANFSMFTIEGLSRNRKKGTAKLTVNVPGPGVLALGGHGVKPQRPIARRPVRAKPVAAAGRVHLLVKAKGSKKRKLRKTGKVKLKLSITYTPTGGTAAHQSLSVKLKRKR
jgi:Metallo-peptidase family M12B Reprolysin-like